MSYTSDTREANNRLLAAAMFLSPDGKVQHAFSELYNGTPYEDRTLALLSAILDGLQHGNWPQCTHVIATELKESGSPQEK
jgi:hypothetical protein